MIGLPGIKCATENHRSMHYQFVCMDPLCQQNNTHLACLYCCQEFHQQHIHHVVAIKAILTEMASKQQGGKGFNMLPMLLQGIQTCSTFKELQGNLTELLAYRNNADRFEELVDEEAEALQRKAQEYYKRAGREAARQEVSRKASQLAKPLTTPVLTFREGTHTLNSPFSVAIAHTQLTTIFAVPSLSKFHTSIDVTLKIDRYTPSWLAVGVSIGQAKYEQGSAKHILAISNGWISNKGVVDKWKVKFGGGDTVRLRWHKNMELLQLVTSKGDKGSVRLQNSWREEIFLCVCLFYAGDSVRLL